MCEVAKNIVHKSQGNLDVLKISKELENEGKLRELIRDIQSKRKELGKKPYEEINLVIPEQFLVYQTLLKRKVLAKKIEVGPELQILL